MKLPLPSGNTGLEPWRAGRRPRPLTSLIVRPLVLPVLLLLLMGGLVVWSLNLSVRNAHFAQASQGRLLLLRQLLTDISNMENGERRYVITGQPSFLEPYRRGQQNFAEHLRRYEPLIVTDRQRENIGRVETLIAQWELVAAQPEIAARRVSLESAVARVSAGTGRHLTDEARETLNVMIGFENERLSNALKASNAALRRLLILTPLLLLLGALLLVLAVRRIISTLSLSVSQLTEGTQRIAAGHYEQRVQPLGITELDRLSAQFHRMAEAVQQREAELAESARSLERTNASLQRSNRELERFAYVASHDLQEPLRTIGSYTELIARRYSGQLDARGEQYIKFTISATHRLKTLIQDLLVFSRVHRTGRVFGPVDTAELAGQVRADLEVRLREVGGELHVGELPTVQGNRELLHHIFLNLIGNALKFRHPDRAPQVRVWAERSAGSQATGPQATGPGWQFAVQDNGIGIEPQYHEKIFEVFQRLHGVGDYEGSGIGLAVTRNAAEQHGGRVWPQSEPGQGTTFFFFLPDTPPAAEQP